MTIHPAVWEDFTLFSKVLYRVNKEAEIYDVFMMLRADQGSKPLDPNSQRIKDIDAEIEIEERKKNGH